MDSNRIVHFSASSDQTQMQQIFSNQLRQNIQAFWNDRLIEINEVPDVHGQQTLPLARIKKIMKSNEQVKMISADTSIVFAKACEFFIKELTLRASMHAEENNRKTVRRIDIANAIRDEDLLHFLRNSVPLASNQEEPVFAQLGNPAVFAPIPGPAPVPYANPGGYPAEYPMDIQSLNQAVGSSYARSQPMHRPGSSMFRLPPPPPPPSPQPQPPSSS